MDDAPSNRHSVITNAVGIRVAIQSTSWQTECTPYDYTLFHPELKLILCMPD